MVEKDTVSELEIQGTISVVIHAFFKKSASLMVEKSDPWLACLYSQTCPCTYEFNEKLVGLHPLTNRP